MNINTGYVKDLVNNIQIEWILLKDSVVYC